MSAVEFKYSMMHMPDICNYECQVSDTLFIRLSIFH